MNLTVFTGEAKTVYRLPVDRDLNEAIVEAKRQHPSWTRIKIIVNRT
jgi:hypothetical protein